MGVSVKGLAEVETARGFGKRRYLVADASRETAWIMNTSGGSKFLHGVAADFD
jgi:hypothetical protein